MVSAQPVNTVKCKYCGHSTITRCGSYKGVPRYFCKVCRRKFRPGNTLYHMRVPVAYVSDALDMYYEGNSINRIRVYLRERYGYYPAWSLIYKWLEKFTGRAADIFSGKIPQAGKIWIAGQTQIKLQQHSMFVYEVMDERSRFVIARFMTPANTAYPARKLMQEALPKAAGRPRMLLTCITKIGNIEPVLGDIELVPVLPSAPEEYPELVTDFQDILSARLRFLRTFTSLRIVTNFLNGWTIYHNYFKPRAVLGGARPAEAAGIAYDVKSWKELCQSVKY